MNVYIKDDDLIKEIKLRINDIEYNISYVLKRIKELDENEFDRKSLDILKSYVYGIEMCFILINEYTDMKNRLERKKNK